MDSRKATRELAERYGFKAYNIAAATRPQTPKQMGAALWCRRTALGYTQREVASLAGTSVSSYCRMENGHPVGTDVLLNVMTVLEMQIRFVLKEKGDG